MKELSVQHRVKPLRAFFAFDPLRQAITLCIGNKSDKKLFYTGILAIADELYLIREELEISQKELAETLGIKQPSLSAIEDRGNDLKISTMKSTLKLWAESSVLM